MADEIAKIVSKTEAFWTRVKDQSDREIEALQNQITLNQELSKVASLKIAEEQAKSA